MRGQLPGSCRCGGLCAAGGRRRRRWQHQRRLQLSPAHCQLGWYFEGLGARRGAAALGQHPAPASLERAGTQRCVGGGGSTGWRSCAGRWAACLLPCCVSLWCFCLGCDGRKLLLQACQLRDCRSLRPSLCTVLPATAANISCECPILCWPPACRYGGWPGGCLRPPPAP
jgi:hypothetical protein